MVAKLLLPTVFEKFTMQDLRALIAEKSRMKIYIRGELVEPRGNSIFILLEGFIKAQGCHVDLIGPPATFLSPDVDVASFNLGSSGNEIASLLTFIGLTLFGSISGDLTFSKVKLVYIDKGSTKGISVLPILDNVSTLS